MGYIVNIVFGIAIPLGLAFILCSLTDFDYLSLSVYLTMFMGISFYCNLIEFWMYMISFILMIILLIFKFNKNSSKGVIE